jgi:glutathione S-transferase
MMLCRRYGLETNQERVKEMSERLVQKLDVYEQILSKQKYLAGDVGTFSFDIVDLWNLKYFPRS